MVEHDGHARDLAALTVPLTGSLQDTGDPWLPYRLVNPAGEPVEAVLAYFGDLQAIGRSTATIRSYVWTYCVGSGSCGRSGSRGTGSPG